MIDQNSDRGTGRRDQLAYVCAELERIHTDLETHSTTGVEPLERLIAALSAGTDPTAPLDALHEALLAAGDAAGINGRADRGLNPIGIGPALPAEWVLLCPSGQCSRHCWPEGPDAPRCRISDQPLRRERL